jgi:hypothetical protein
MKPLPNEKEIWFPAKRYGYGWGPPVRWQGWVVLLIYLLAIAGGMRAFLGPKHPNYFVIYVGVLSVALIAICTWKGEPPRWRWGKD